MTRVSKPVLAILAVATLLSSGNASADNSDWGTILGGIAGGILGNQVGGGSGKDIATAVGIIGGAIVGHEIGEDMDRREAERAAYSSMRAPVNQSSEWRGRSSYGSYRTTREYYQNGARCRSWISVTYVNGRPVERQGEMCEYRDGSIRSWETERRTSPPVVVTPQPVPVRPAPYPVQRAGVYCDRAGANGQFVALNNGIVIGPGYGTRSFERCQDNIANSFNGLICVSQGNAYQPFRIASNSPVGIPGLGFRDLTDCWSAVQNSSAQVCNWNNVQFVSIDVYTNHQVYGFGQDLDRCVTYTNALTSYGRRR